MRLKVKNSIEILGYCDIRTQKESDRRRLLVTDLIPLKNNGTLWAYRVGTKSLGSGKTARVTVRADVFNINPFDKGEIIKATDIYKNKAGFWYLSSYLVE